MTVVGVEVVASAVDDAVSESAAHDDVVGLPAHDDVVGSAGHDDVEAVIPGDTAAVASAADDAAVTVGSAAHEAGFAAAEVQQARRALEVLARRVASGPADGGTRADWAGLVAGCQSLGNITTAVQHTAIARLSAIEEEWLEDGTVVETHRPPGHVALDAPDILAGALGVSHVHAQRRVSLAVRLAAGAEPDTEGSAGSGSGTGLAGLHRAMADGRLDGYRAGVVAEELAEAPAEVAATVVEVLEPHLADETAVHLRRRCRRALARISPDLLRRRAERARKACGLRRWVDEPGVDRWEGTFPSEDAAEGWAAVDALAQRYVAEGRCQRVEAARARALIDLIRGQATIDVQLVVTVPATSTQQLAVPSDRSHRSEPSDPSERSEPSDPSESSRSGQPMEPLAPTRSREDLVEVAGLVPGEPVLAKRGWVESVQTAGTVRLAPCHPRSGALLDRATTCSTQPMSLLTATTAATSYRQTGRLAALVRARDGRCRFPGCSVAARFCDLDHVRPWPAGPTTAANLMCLCRRHHRIKQRPGWTVRLLPDARAVWSDPTGRIRGSDPRNLLDLVVLPARSGESSPDRRPARDPGSALAPSGTSPLGSHTARRSHTALGSHAACESTSPPAMPPASPRGWAPEPPPWRESGGQGPHPSGPVGPTPLEVLLGVLGDHGPPARPDGDRWSRHDRRVHRAPPLRGCRVRYVDGRAGHAPMTNRRRSPAEPGVLRDTGPPPF